MSKGNDKTTEKRTEETDTLEISGEDAAFILGAGGKTKSNSFEFFDSHAPELCSGSEFDLAE